jgi:hypothetical protein
MSKHAKDMLAELDKVEALSDFQKAQIEHIINVAYNDGCIDQLHKFMTNNEH